MIARGGLLLAVAFTLSGCASGTGFAPVGPALGAVDPEPAYDVPYVSTPPAVVAAMLDLAALTPGELLVDLGSGDGRIPLAAGRRGARARGVEIDPALAARAAVQARQEGLDASVRFVREDLFGAGIRDADVVAIYLLPDINRRLEPKLLTELRPGTRIVSHAFLIGDWTPDEHRVVHGRNIYLWTVPAVAGGRWQLRRADGSTAILDIDQRRQQLKGTLAGQPIRDTVLSGRDLSFTTATGERMRASVGDAEIVSVGTPAWTARRLD